LATLTYQSPEAVPNNSNSVKTEISRIFGFIRDEDKEEVEKLAMESKVS
jgi:hypothetical protein